MNHIPCVFIRKTGATQLIIYSHANAMDLGLITPQLMSRVSDWNVNILAYEYPGYCLAPGRPDMISVNASLRTVFEFARHSLQWPAENIILFGRSIGTGPTCRIVRELSDRKEPIGTLCHVLCAKLDDFPLIFSLILLISAPVFLCTGGLILLSPFLDLQQVARSWFVLYRVAPLG
jgi:hypothetical protein